MADEESQSEESGESFCVYLGMLDPRLERLLWHLEDEPKKDVVTEIASEFVIEDLLNAREKLFERALRKVKAAQCLPADTNQHAVNQENKLALPQNSKYIAIPWKLIKRRIVSLAAMDICEIYLYLLVEGTEFPTRILKRKPMATNMSKDEIARMKMDVIHESTENSGDVSKRCENPRLDLLFEERDVTPEIAETNAYAKNDLEKEENNMNVHVQRESVEGSIAKNMSDVKCSEKTEEDGPIIDVFMPQGDEMSKENVTEEVFETKRENGLDKGDGHYIDHPRQEHGNNNKEDVNVNKHANKNDLQMDPGRDDSIATNVMSVPTGPETTMLTADDLVAEERDNPKQKSDKRECEPPNVHEMNTPAIYNKDSCSGETPINDHANDVEKQTKTQTDVTKEPGLTIITKQGLNNLGAEVSPRKDSRGDRYANEQPKYISVPVPRSTSGSTRQSHPPNTSPNELLDDSDLSQASFLREILEIHSRVTSSSPKKVQCSYKPRKISVDMATQTSVNIVDDKPVMKSEFDCQTARIDRALTDHERRTRSIEIWQGTAESQVAKVDADAFNNNMLLKTAFEMMVDELKNTKEIVGEMIEQANEREAAFETMVQRDRERELVLDKMIARKCKCNPGDAASNDNTTNDQMDYVNKSKPREAKEKDSAIDSFMKAARKMIGPNPRQTVVDGKETPLQSTPHASRADSEKGPGIGGNAQEKTGHNPDIQNQRGKMTPCIDLISTEAGASKDVSWADEADEDTAVDDFIASVVINDTGHSQLETPLTNKKQSAAPNPMSIPGLKPVPDLRCLNPPPNQVQPAQKTDQRDNTRVAKSTNNNTTGNEYPRRTPTPYALPTSDKPKAAEDMNPPQSRNKSMGVKQGGAQNDNRQQKGAPRDNNGFDNNGNKENGAGARPKTMISGESMMFRDSAPSGASGIENKTGTQHDNVGKQTYAEMASKNKWNPPPSKRKRTKSSPKAFKPISGATINENKDVYVRGLATKNFSNSEELEDSVRYYCRERGVNIVFARVMTNNVNANAVGCRVCIREEDLNAIYEEGFWPNKVEVREWYQRPRERRPSKNFYNAGAAYEG